MVVRRFVQVVRFVDHEYSLRKPWKRNVRLVNTSDDLYQAVVLDNPNFVWTCVISNILLTFGDQRST